MKFGNADIVNALKKERKGGERKCCKDKAKDAGGLTPVKDDNAVIAHFARQTVLLFECVDYIILEKLKREHIDRLVKIAGDSGLSGITGAVFEKELSNKIADYTVALCGNVPIGFVGIWNIAGECEIVDIAVDSSFRRRGVAHSLIKNVIEKCRISGVSAIYLEVRESNIPALLLYEKTGFERIGIRKGYYSDGENAVMMKRNVK